MEMKKTTRAAEEPPECSFGEKRQRYTQEQQYVANQRDYGRDSSWCTVNSQRVKKAERDGEKKWNRTRKNVGPLENLHRIVEASDRTTEGET